MPLLSEPEYIETVGSPNSPVEAVFSTHSISGVSIIIQTLGNQSLQDKKYKLEVSNNQDSGYVTLREITMGDAASYDTSFSLYNEAIYSSILHFAWVKLSIPAIDQGVAVRVIVSKR